MRSRSLRLVLRTPCTADWNAMRPIERDGRARLCGACDKPVYDSRSMTHADLQRLIFKHEGPLPCLRLHQRPDGTIVTKSCFAPVMRAGRFLWLKTGLAAVAFWSAVYTFWSWTRRPVPSVIETAVLADTETHLPPVVVKPLELPDVLPGPKVTRRSLAKEAAKHHEIEVFLGGFTDD